MVEPLELWQRLGHASYRDWVLAAQRAHRVTIAAKKAAAKATTPAVQRQPSPPSPPPHSKVTMSVTMSVTPVSVVTRYTPVT